MLPGQSLQDSSHLQAYSKANIQHLSTIGRDSSCLIDLSFSDSNHTLQFKESQASINPWEPVHNKSKPPSRAPQVKVCPPTAPRKISSYQRTRPNTYATKIDQSLVDCTNLLTTETYRPTMQVTEDTIMDQDESVGVQATVESKVEPEVNQRKRATTEIRQSNEGPRIVEALNKTVGRQPNAATAKVVNIKFRTTRDYLLPLLSQKTKPNAMDRADKTFNDMKLFDMMSYGEPSFDYYEEEPMRESKETSFFDLYNMMQDLAAAKIEQETKRDEYVPEMFFRNFDEKKEKAKPKVKRVDCWRKGSSQLESPKSWNKWGYDPKPITQGGKVRLPYMPEKDHNRTLTLSTNTDLSRDQDRAPKEMMLKPVKPKRSNTVQKNRDDLYNLDSLMKVRMLGAVFMRKNTISPEPKRIDFSNENRKKKAFENYMKPMREMAEARRF